MEFEAPPCQSIKRSATAPVEGQEATRLAGGRTGDGMTFYDGRPRAASACEVGDCGTDRATTANHDARARTHSSYLCQSWLPSSRAALVEGRPFTLDVALAAGVEILTSSPSVSTLDWRGPLTNVRFAPLTERRPGSMHGNGSGQCVG